jgi:hypothetical protein
MKYCRLELSKRELQDLVTRRLGIEINDPEGLVYAGITDVEVLNIYEEPDDDDDNDLVIIVECYCRRRPRRQ